MKKAIAVSRALEIVADYHIDVTKYKITSRFERGEGLYHTYYIDFTSKTSKISFEVWVEYTKDGDEGYYGINV